MISVKDYFWCILRNQDDNDMDGFIKSYIELMKNDQLARMIYNIDNSAYMKVYEQFDLGDEYQINDERKELWFMKKVRAICYRRYLVNIEPYDYIEDERGRKVPIDSEGNIMDIEGVRDCGSEDIILKGVFSRLDINGDNEDCGDCGDCGDNDEIIITPEKDSLSRSGSFD